jgi:hypothetical protein
VTMNLASYRVRKLSATKLPTSGGPRLEVNKTTRGSVLAQGSLVRRPNFRRFALTLILNASMWIIKFS